MRAFRARRAAPRKRQPRTRQTTTGSPMVRKSTRMTLKRWNLTMTQPQPHLRHHRRLLPRLAKVQKLFWPSREQPHQTTRPRAAAAPVCRAEGGALRGRPSPSASWTSYRGPLPTVRWEQSTLGSGAGGKLLPSNSTTAPGMPPSPCERRWRCMRRSLTSTSSSCLARASPHPTAASSWSSAPARSLSACTAAGRASAADSA
mmetsp:Transcript_22029/g.65908  ORF Transcript_22029/g.65908 Transcript_22029/m.65908 type:complete len:202 (-) Transcript_22029:1459-2064(-)